MTTKWVYIDYPAKCPARRIAPDLYTRGDGTLVGRSSELDPGLKAPIVSNFDCEKDVTDRCFQLETWFFLCL